MSFLKKRKIITGIIAVVMFCVFFFSATAASAQLGLGGATEKLKTTADKAGVQRDGDLGTIVGNVINTALALVGTIFLVLTVYGGFLWMTARGEEDQITKAKGIIRSSIIGLVIVVSAYAITFFVTSRFK